MVDNYTDKLDENKQQFDAAQEIANLGYWELDLNDKSMHWTPRLFKIFGVKRTDREVTLSTLLKLVQESDSEKLNECFMKAVEKGKPFTCEVHMKSNKQKLICRSRPYLNDKKVVTKIMRIIQQIDE